MIERQMSMKAIHAEMAALLTNVARRTGSRNGNRWEWDDVIQDVNVNEKKFEDAHQNTPK